MSALEPRNTIPEVSDAYARVVKFVVAWQGLADCIQHTHVTDLAGYTHELELNVSDLRELLIELSQLRHPLVVVPDVRKMIERKSGRMMYQIGVEGDLFDPHLWSPECVSAGCAERSSAGVYRIDYHE